MKTKKEIIEKLVGVYEFHVQMAMNCREWIKKAESPSEAKSFEETRKSHYQAIFEIEYILDECGIPYKEIEQIEAEAKNGGMAGGTLGV